MGSARPEEEHGAAHGAAARPTSPSGPLLLATAIVILLLGGVFQVLTAPDDGAQPSAAATATTPAPSLPTTPPATSPTSPPPAHTPAAGALVGSVRVTDATGDVRDAEGAPPSEGQAAADLVAVQLDGDGEHLAVTFLLAGDVAPAELSLLWSVRIWVDDVLSYEITAQHAGGQIVAGVFDWDSDTQQPLPEPAEVTGNRIILRVPVGLLPRLPAAFSWAGFSELDGAYNDTVPDAAEALLPAPDERARFP